MDVMVSPTSNPTAAAGDVGDTEEITAPDTLKL
jgi:hypothetical protein